jgi:hypothetical protein
VKTSIFLIKNNHKKEGLFFVTSSLKKALLTFVILSGFSAFFLSFQPVYADQVYWVGTTGNWDDASKWSSGSVPTAADDVFITSTPPITVAVPDGVNADFSTLTISDSSLNLIGNIGNGGSLSLSRGQLIQSNNVQQVLQGTLNVGENGNLTHASNGLSELYTVNFKANRIQIDPFGLITASAQGYAGGAVGDGLGLGGGKGSVVGSAGGGGYGGRGGNGSGSLGGESYCEPTQITKYGSGGGKGFGGDYGGYGAGLIFLAASDTIDINGFIAAEGEMVSNSEDGGGAGGGIVIQAPHISGSPQAITVQGGQGGSNAGGGGGGCVFLYYTVSNTITDVFANGGSGLVSGAIGTVLIVGPTIPPGTPVFTDDLTSSSIRYNWTYAAGGANYYILERSTDGTNFDFVATSSPLTLTKYSFGGLLKNSRYWFRVASANGIFPTSTYTNSLPVYTLANTPNAPEYVRSANTSTVEIKINANTLNDNSIDVPYVVKDQRESGVYFLQSSGSWDVATTTLSIETIGFASPTSTSGLAPNTRHTISLASVNRDGELSPFGESRTVYTHASVPKNLATFFSAAQRKLGFSWSGDGSQYYVENLSTAEHSDWFSGSSYDFSNINCGALYAVRVKARNGDAAETQWASLSVQTPQCTNGGSPGYFDPSPPELHALKVDSVTSSGAVLSFTVDRAAFVSISENNFQTPSVWNIFSPHLEYAFASGRIPAKLYVKFATANSRLESSVYSVVLPTFPTESLYSTSLKLP